MASLCSSGWSETHYVVQASPGRPQLTEVLLCLSLPRVGIICLAMWCWGWVPGLCTYQASSLPTELHPNLVLEGLNQKLSRT